MTRQTKGGWIRSKAGIIIFVESGNYPGEVKAVFRVSNLMSVQMGVNASHKEN